MIDRIENMINCGVIVRRKKISECYESMMMIF